MRKEPTVAERMLWAALRKLGANYRRQVPIGRYIVDFAHFESKLLIEIDGYFHSLPEAAEKDVARTAWLVSAGYRVIRFNEREVRDNLPFVVDTIVAETLSPPSPTLPPSRGKGGEASHA
jgi:very-short-patch-repair endonuclease